MAAPQVRLQGVGKVFMAGEPPAPLHAVDPSISNSSVASSSPWSAPRAAANHAARAHCSLTPATQGSIEFRGTAIAGKAPEGMGVVFQDDASLPWLDVTANVAFGLRRADLSREAKGQARARRPRARRVVRFRDELSGAALGRHAPARVHRPHARDAAAAHPPRRAVRRPRPADAIADGATSSCGCGGRPTRRSS